MFIRRSANDVHLLSCEDRVQIGRNSLADLVHVTVAAYATICTALTTTPVYLSDLQGLSCGVPLCLNHGLDTLMQSDCAGTFKHSHSTLLYCASIIILLAQKTFV